jgi:ABC-type spermidine/putrescine transport system permease subunit II
MYRFRGSALVSTLQLSPPLIPYIVAGIAIYQVLIHHRYRKAMSD